MIQASAPTCPLRKFSNDNFHVAAFTRRDGSSVPPIWLFILLLAFMPRSGFTFLFKILPRRRGLTVSRAPISPRRILRLFTYFTSA